MEWLETGADPIIQVCVMSYSGETAHIFISGMRMGYNWSVAEEMEKHFDDGDYDDRIFDRGDGEYMLRCLHEPDQVGEYGRIEIKGGWYFEVIDFREFPEEMQPEEEPLFDTYQPEEHVDPEWFDEIPF